MTEAIQLFHRSAASAPRLSVLIPSWNNLPYLQLCVRSLRSHSVYTIQLIIIINEGTDGTLEWVKNEVELDYVYAPVNIGICYGLNSARPLVQAEYMLYANDDMYFLPGWDTTLMKEIEAIGHKHFMLSATMIEPQFSGNPCVVHADYGSTPNDFREQDLLQQYSGHFRTNWSGSTWPPNILHRDLWDLVGGMSIEFSPGMYSDPDLSRKLFHAGVRLFRGMGHSLVYHFRSKSTGRIKRNNGRKTFLMKWGISAGLFNREFLRLGTDFSGPLEAPAESGRQRLLRRFKMMWSSLRD